MTHQHPTERAQSPSHAPGHPSGPLASPGELNEPHADAQPPADLAALRDRIAHAIDGAFQTFDPDHTEDAQLSEHLTDAVLAVLPDHGRQVDAANVARRIRRILTGLDDRPLDDEELRLVALLADGMRQQNLDAAAAAIQRAERAERLAERHAERNAADAIHAAQCAERAEAERDQHAAQLALTREQVRLVRDTCDRLLNQSLGERTRWLHVVIEGGDEYTANRSALSLRDWLQAEFGDGIAMRITTDAREQADTTEGSAR